jgi:hypothetical protein
VYIHFEHNGVPGDLYRGELILALILDDGGGPRSERAQEDDR